MPHANSACVLHHISRLEHAELVPFRVSHHGPFPARLLVRPHDSGTCVLQANHLGVMIRDSPIEVHTILADLRLVDALKDEFRASGSGAQGCEWLSERSGCVSKGLAPESSQPIRL
jgi:hypothetical protein